jgi:hypothetical protein
VTGVCAEAVTDGIQHSLTPLRFVVTFGEVNVRNSDKLTTKLEAIIRHYTVRRKVAVHL